MSLVIRLALSGFFIGLLVIGQTWLPPFPPAFEQFFETFFTKILLLDTWFPVKLTISLLVITAGVEVAQYSWKFGKWFKDFVFGDPKP